MLAGFTLANYCIAQLRPKDNYPKMGADGWCANE